MRLFFMNCREILGSFALDRELVPIWNKFKDNKNDCIFQQSSVSKINGLGREVQPIVRKSSLRAILTISTSLLKCNHFCNQKDLMEVHKML